MSINSLFTGAFLDEVNSSIALQTQGTFIIKHFQHLQILEDHYKRNDMNTCILL